MSETPKKLRTSHRDALPWPGRKRGGHIVAELSRQPATIVGPHPDKLAAAIERSFKRIMLKEADGYDDLIPSDQEDVVERDVAVIQLVLRKLLRATRSHSPMFAEPSEPYSSLPGSPTDVDTVLIAAQRELPANSAGDAIRLAAAARLLAGLDIQEVPKSNGLPPVVDPIYMIVRVVVGYLRAFGMPVTERWDILKNREEKKGEDRDDSECVPISPDTILLRLVCDLWELDVRNATLRVALRSYLAELRRERRRPRPSDRRAIEFASR